MPKTYDFKFAAIPATWEDGVCSMMLTNMIDPPSEIVTGLTLAEAKAHLANFSARTPGPHVAMLEMANRRDRKPPGFYAVRNIEKR